MRENLLETIIGGIVIFIAALILGYAYVNTQDEDIDGYNLKASFDRADGVVEGSDVKVSGIKVGKVSSLALDSGTYSAVATLLIYRHVNLPVDTSAAIVSESLLGGKYISLSPGSDDKILKPNEQIHYTQSSIMLESLIGKLIFNNDEKKDKDDKK
jgi:phospholipid/cholesterol/gamma-HCH transport system substrate-binding protein